MHISLISCPSFLGLYHFPTDAVKAILSVSQKRAATRSVIRKGLGIPNKLAEIAERYFCIACPVYREFPIILGYQEK